MCKLKISYALPNGFSSSDIAFYIKLASDCTRFLFQRKYILDFPIPHSVKEDKFTLELSWTSNSAFIERRSEKSSRPITWSSHLYHTTSNAPRPPSTHVTRVSFALGKLSAIWKPITWILTCESLYLGVWFHFSRLSNITLWNNAFFHESVRAPVIVKYLDWLHVCRGLLTSRFHNPRNSSWWNFLRQLESVFIVIHTLSEVRSRPTEKQ